MPANVATSKPPASQGGNQNLIQGFLSTVRGSSDVAIYGRNYLSWTKDSRRIDRTSTIHSFSIGTGAEIIESICPAIENAKREVVLVTCFWAKSTSQQRLAASILSLAQKAQRDQRLVNVRICLSSLSLWQKLTQTSSLNGHIYPSSMWSATFGLPRHDDLMEDGNGVQLTIKSIFVRPMSVMHPKCIIIDQTRLFLPSCNISWEDWFEGMIEMSGGIIDSFLDFHRSFWEGRPNHPLEHASTAATSADVAPSRPITTLHVATQERTFSDVHTLFLPSSHHRYPHFRPLPCLAAPPPPATPLNIFLLQLFAHATHSIHIQTPNLTSPPVLGALGDALARGVDASIITSTRMMVIEQIVTAGTITEFCVNGLVRGHRSLFRSWQRRSGGGEVDESAAPRPGRLSVRYFVPGEGGVAAVGAVKSHLKMTVVDGEVVVLGSGNMDRASWYTSQEIGVAVFGREIVAMIRGKVDEALKGRLGREMADQVEGEAG
ncbi:MAG: hypothetical protein OHK93_004911 [Ramalina farinacea]|uniref:PLD phosphodiesterase domain-containing protein n=1 Tax=Ramalina farinacea TaxID=258253 RepID=A0AA43TZ53_9LECA|nr:hypothetical protein [Ramalina farinacea]